MIQAMDIHKMNNFALLLVLALFTSQLLIANAGPYHVYIQNGFKDSILGAHCKSKDNDLGLQYIAINGEFQWKFRSNFFHTTLFFCDLSWVGGHQTFDAFVDEDDFLGKNCAGYDCYWKAQEDGIYSFNPGTRKYELQYTWEH